VEDENHYLRMREIRMTPKTVHSNAGGTRDALLPELVRALPAEYQVVDEYGEVVSPEAAILGEGGASVVLRALYKNTLKRALKIVIPRDDIRPTVDQDQLLSTYNNEVASMAELNHEHIAKVTDFGQVHSERAGSFPFIVTEQVDGPSLLDFAEQAQTTGEDIIRALRQVLSALAYMHSRRIMHCDLKPGNIVVSRIGGMSGEPSATIIDLGSSKQFSSARSVAEETELVYLFSTHRYVIPELRNALGNRTLNRISKKDLRTYFPAQDLFSFSQIVQDLLAKPTVAEKIRNVIGSNWSEVLEFFREKLYSAKSGKCGTARACLEALDRISMRSMAPLHISELSSIPGKGILIPTTGLRAAGSDNAQLIISHPMFQRMHRLLQLDLLQYVFPGATGTRFAHTLHAYELARSAITQLLADWRFRLDVTRQDIEAILFSSLLNPVGHYHFLHMFEDFIEERNSEPLVKNAGLLRDDELLDQVMMGGEIAEKSGLAYVDDLKGRTLADITSNYLGLDWAEARRRQRGPSGPLEGVLAALLSCPVDVDKLAYLAGDSAATGLAFGNAISPAPLFESLCLPSYDDWIRNSNPNPIVLGVREKAISYLEADVLIRYWNIQTGYWNRTNRSLQAMVKFQIASLLRAERFDFSRYLAETLHISQDGALRWLNDHFLAARNEGAIDSETVNPIEDLLLSRRLIYKRLLTISGKSRISNRQPDYKIFERLRALSPLKDHQVCGIIAEVLESVVPGLEIRPGEVLLDVPRARQEEAGGRVLVYTDDGREQLGELFTISPFMEQHRESFELHVKRLRVFLHPRVYDELQDRGRLSTAYLQCLTRLREEYAT
jgi:HD superfamily phosphohydrolase/tRNA A-37 threonylcarbamoyl transferase component Bud32